MYSNNPECLTQTINQLKIQYTTCTSTLHLHTNTHPESLLDLNYNLPQLVSSMRPCWQANKWTNKRAIPYFMSYHRKTQWQCVRLEHNRKKIHCSLALIVCLLMPFLCSFSYTTTGDAYSMYVDNRACTCYIISYNKQLDFVRLLIHKKICQCQYASWTN